MSLLKTTLAFLFLLLTTTFAMGQHAIVNLDTVTYHGYTDTVDYAPLLINTNGNVVISGNQKVTATQYDAHTASQLTDGVTVWANSFNAGSDKSYITASVNDDNGNVIVVGGVKTATGSSVDFMVLKYDPSGNLLWSKFYDGPNGTTDVALAVTVDNNGFIYVTGASDGTLTALTDYATICYNSTGIQIWCTRYDYSDNIDIPTAIEYNVGTNAIIVTGSSGTSLLDWDFATLEYDASTGAQLHETRNTNSNGAQDKVLSMSTDSIGNVYIAGTVYNGSNYDLQVTKLDTLLSVLWTQTFDGYGHDDAGVNLALDDSLNIYVAGVTHLSSAKKEMLLLKYTSNGTLVWARPTQTDQNISMEATRVIVKSDNEIFVGGTYLQNGNQDVAILRYNSNGRITMERIFNGPANGKDQFMDMEIEGNNIYVSARTYSAGVDYNIIIHYSYRNIIYIATTDTVSDVSHIQGEVDVTFNKSALKMNKINDIDFVFGKLSDFVNDSTCDKIEDILDPIDELRIDAKNIEARKIFCDLTEADSLSETRLGTMIKVPEFYTKLCLTMPPGLLEIAVADSLNKIHPDIHHATLNYIIELDWVPNDIHYGQLQSSLHPTTLYPNAHINLEPAWDITKGESFIRVGVYDSGVNHIHEDLVGSAVHNATYLTPQQSSTGTGDAQLHGTNVASIIGAKSNNNTTGIAGIAGGDGQLLASNAGVKIYNMKMFEDLFIATSQNLLVAYMDGASGSNLPKGKALHVMNNSYGIKNLASDPDIQEAINYCNRNGVAFVASRGNFGHNSWTSTLVPNAPTAPATFLPTKVMNVGASGTDGQFHKIGVNGALYTSAFDKNVDFVAPGAEVNIYSCISQTGVPTWLATNNSYVPFSGTSASAPHVSGVAALMMSSRNQSNSSWDNLVHEDCEELLKLTATDLLASFTYSQSNGPDFVTGHGRINAGAAVLAVQPQYNIRHIDANHYATSTSVNTYSLPGGWNFVWNGSPTSTVPANQYIVTREVIETTYQYNFSSETYIHSWPLYMASYGSPSLAIPFLTTDDLAYAEVLSATTTSALVRTYNYKLNTVAGSSVAITGQWIPLHPSQIKTAFTLYTLAPPVEITEKETKIDYFNVYPNPSSGDFTLGLNSKGVNTGCIKVFDLMGRIVHQENQGIKFGHNQFNLSLNHLPSGIYLLNLEVEKNRTLVKKLIIN